MTIRERIEAVLREGPATSAELVLELGMERRHVNANLCDLHKRGKLAREPFYGDGHSRKWVWLYSVPEQARRAA